MCSVFDTVHGEGPNPLAAPKLVAHQKTIPKLAVPDLSAVRRVGALALLEF